ncbi:hypothetical protein A2303_01465 [Candidatus Falkowbacteria bacterium RIFOXYB2_FULL_47_14]|uniref:Uncharacterized protein n=1 Tax=Candidatus Falkowbacteria bacterium RIFOXYA2_FULL_47_19 TaxID=1797994 RepID=A0A1F5SM42_9BACT|nr:MAG: hypothetical protein A2227_01540 [Candidatus Falkowbacteria bacterium RIFOXYA2_FULL_47_19]OGF34763.1 MAG: hypothetical protein A2468_03430 [Candidatus Falkowbacteria bacterium RIFOXYC2_FULL_46_15]OGF43453.1 MAG: hypothetical protein A2303_01465 [Candidatus Falkowbacteria bacterium RIFOXYB2_FULL_47_14]
MMFFRQAVDLILPYLQHPDYEEFESKTPRLQELTNQIREAMKNVNPDHPLGQGCILVDEKMEMMFREFADICKQGLGQVE